MSSIVSLKLSGFRSYYPDNQITIEFFKPLTLIWGKNGSGKTTIIECLKFITTGCLPPNSSQGRSFVMDPRIALRPEVVAQVTLNCMASGRNVPIIAHRKVILTSTNKGPRFESKQQSITLKDLNGKQMTVNHHCAQIQRQIPMILGINKPILQNIVFCHQEESLWPFADSNTLKQIFDQLFETNTFTKYMEHIWQIHRQQNKRLKELKVRIQYQEKINTTDQQIKTACLQELQTLQKQSQTLQEMKLKLDNLKKQTIQNTQLIKHRQIVLLRIGSFQNQIRNLRDQIKISKQSYYQLKKDPQKKYSKLAQIGFQRFQQKNKSINPQKENMEIEVPLVDIEQAKKLIEQKQNLIQALKNQKEELKQTINQQKNKSDFNKKLFEIQMQIKRILEIYPQLKDNNEQHILQNLSNKIKYMDNFFNSLKIFKRQIEAIEQETKNTYITEPNLTQEQYLKVKKQLNTSSGQLEKLQLKIIFTYKTMYKPLKNSQTQYSGPSQLQSKLSNLQAIIKSKNEEMADYQKMWKQKQKQKQKSRPKTQPVQQTIQQLNFLGIVAQQKNLHFCKQNQKCNVCLKALTQAQIKQIQKKTNQIIQKTQKTIKRLKEQNSKKQVYIDPEVMIKKLKEQLVRLNQHRDVLKFHMTAFLENKKRQNQQKINNILQLEYKKCRISQQQFNRAKGKVSQEHTMQIQQFKELVSTYLFKVQVVNNLRQKVLQYDSIVNKNQKINKMIQENANKKQELKKSIEKTQNQVKYYEATISMHKKLQQLLKSKRGRPANSKKKQLQKERFKNIELAEEEYANICKTIIKQEQNIRQLAIQMKYTHFSGQQNQKLKNLKEHKRTLQKIDVKLQNSKQKAEQLNKLTIQYIGQRKRIENSVKDIQYKLQKPQQKLYEIYKIKQLALEKSVKDLQNLYNAIQVSINNYHEQKMMEINNILKEVWADVYNGDDIQYIQIQTSPDQETSRRKKLNLNYSIVMKKRTHKKTENQTTLIQMKGRCSVGQKVLASIIIRLALAESFSTNSKILALDQPTTNLDKPHIKSLANQLGRLIQLGQQRNLQIIIISHDIQFVQMLEEYATQYYEVYRDSNNFSLVRVRDMKELTSMNKYQKERIQIQRY